MATGPEDDFQGYMENLGRMQEEAEKHAAMMEAQKKAMEQQRAMMEQRNK